ncbi:hypothetical protein FQN54_005412 [Arachnomyces sp. PD_36]|nr:hypothetical protein FQN54_005412 [Arachnomyces sp. PD_36]
MPPKLHGSLSRSLSRLASSTPPPTESVFFCPSRTTWRRSLSSTNTTNSRRTTRRRPLQNETPSTRQRRQYASSPVVVNVTRNIPPRFKELHAALEGVGDVAATHVNLSRLHLALRGLEAERAVVRVAVLSLGDDAATRKLVRLLLADPLGPKEEWEDYLDGYDMSSSQGLLICYGESMASSPKNPLLPTISIPSSTLKKGNLELLVTPFAAGQGPSDTAVTADTFLVPTIAVRASNTGRHSIVRYPVHKSIICASDVEELGAYSALKARSKRSDTDAVHATLNVGLRKRPEKAQGSRTVELVDIEQADEALRKFRESVQNATEYERGWTASGVQPLLGWLLDSKQEGEVVMDPAVRNLVTSLLDSAEAHALESERKKLAEQEAASVSNEIRNELNQRISDWAERAHTELRESLEEDFASKRWAKLAWWRLFWRVDDVGMITSETLQKKWLPQAEKEAIWIGGKFAQAGLMSGLSNGQSASSESPSEGPQLNPRKWESVMQIARTRSKLANTTIPPLQALAQELVLFSVSTTTLTAALSALMYASISSTSLYEACTVTAIGLIYSLRRQEKKWEAARSFWEGEVHEQGRGALNETEAFLRALVRDGGRLTQDVTEKEARAQIEEAKQALTAVK